MIVIIGTGHAGYTLAKEIRKLDANAPLTLITQDDGAAYYKPNLSKAYTMGKSADDLITASADAMAEQLQARLLHNTEVLGINPDTREVHTSQGDVHYSQLVLACGASCIQLPIEGDGAEDILSVNNRLDYAAFRAKAKNAEHVTLIGAGLIGCEFANDLSNQDFQVSVVDPQLAPLAQLLPAAASDALKEALAKNGVDWQLGHTVSSVEKSHRQGYLVTLDNDDFFTSDLVLSAVGLNFVPKWASAANIDCDRGILVNANMQTNQNNIYALGDCAQVTDRVLPFIAPILHQARALAQTLSGTSTAVSLPAMPVIIKTPAYPIIVAAPAEQNGEWTIEPMEDGLICRYQNPQGQLTGFALTAGATPKRMELTRELPPVL